MTGVRLSPTNPTVRYGLACALGALGAYDAGKEEIEKARKYGFPDSKLLQRFELLYSFGAAAKRVGGGIDAKIWELVDGGGDSVDPDQPIGMLGTEMLGSPRFGLAYSTLGVVAAASRKHSAAQHAALIGIGFDAVSPEVRLMAGFVFLQTGRFDDAREQFDVAIGMNGRDTIAYLGRGMASYYLNKPKDALRDSELACSLSPKRADCYLVKGLVLLQLARVNEAIESLQRSLKYDPRSAGANRVLADAYRYAGLTKEAEPPAIEATKLMPKWGHAHYTLGQVYVQSGRRKDAVAAFQRAVGAKRGFYEARLALGRELLSLGILREAHDNLAQAVQDAPRDSSARREATALLTKCKVLRALGSLF
jgi:tetratricopeptide (TPR) repeat protein